MPLEVACNVFDADTEALSEEKRKACWEAHKALSEIVEKLDEVLGTQCLNTCMSTQCTEDSCETLAGAVFTAANVLAIDLNMWRKVLVEGSCAEHTPDSEQAQLGQAAWKELEGLLSDSRRLSFSFLGQCFPTRARVVGSY